MCMKIKTVLSNVLTAAIYLSFTILLAFTGCFLFQDYYYKKIYISGRSMNPTLIGDEGCHNYGYVDTSANAINNLKRFDVIITYYNKWTNPDPEDPSYEDTSYKVKRVWGFPGETITLTCIEEVDPETTTVSKYFNYKAVKNDKVVCDITSEPAIEKEFNISSLKKKEKMLVCRFTYGNKHFYINAKTDNTGVPRHFEDLVLDKKTKTVEGSKDEYFVMGDNWQNSADSYRYVVKDHKANLDKSELQGRVVCIQGVTKYDSVKKETSDQVRLTPRYYF